ncbi:hypothetical protein C9427_05795 [Mesorhizobium helmanticense]|uniref:Transposase IS66 central domain-containing protein n=1 Tax=Mesorhizobium helmanticense TaxID=1776423 RepID=A0A2T4J0L1_9HYPH|nr:hypothetical protein C9427_05795 [Mesorhizobium helmanticense]
MIGQKTKVAKAIRYTLSRCEGLSRFVDDGRTEIDNNTVERNPSARTRSSPARTAVPNTGRPLRR